MVGIYLFISTDSYVEGSRCIVQPAFPGSATVPRLLLLLSILGHSAAFYSTDLWVLPTTGVLLCDPYYLPHLNTTKPQKCLAYDIPFVTLLTLKIFNLCYTFISIKYMIFNSGVSSASHAKPPSHIIPDQTAWLNVLIGLLLTSLPNQCLLVVVNGTII